MVGVTCQPQKKYTMCFDIVNSPYIDNTPVSDRIDPADRHKMTIEHFLIDTFDQSDVKKAFFDTPNLSLVKTFSCDQTFKGKTKTNQIALVRVDDL